LSTHKERLGDVTLDHELAIVARYLLVLLALLAV
jgi:hypothetical protein